MQATIVNAEKHTVRLHVEVPPEEFARDLDRAYRKVAVEVKIPGFRKGKVPKQIIDARVGREHVLEEFVRESLPVYYVRAVKEHDLAPIADPEIDLDQLEVGKPLTFTATVEVRPRLSLEREEYVGVKVQPPSADVTDADVDAYLGQLRERFAELEVVGRPARSGDYVLADVRATRHGQELPEATRLDFGFEIGAQDIVPELDAELEGKRKGEILKFNATLPERFGELAGTEVSFQVLIKEVKGKRLPAADDEFAKTASEFDTLQELREDVRAKLASVKKLEVKAAIRDLVLQRVVDGIEVDIPERLVDEETDGRVQSAHERAARVGTTLAAALESQGWDELRFRSDARSHAVRALKADLVLEAVARQEGIEVTEEDLKRETQALSEATGKDVREVERILERSGQVASLAGDIIRTKALDFLVESADVAEDGVEPTSGREERPTSETEGEQDG